MKLLSKFKLTIVTIIILGISSCANKSKDNFDFSELKLPKKNIPQDNKLKDKIQKEQKISFDLITLDKPKQVTDLINFGKNDPFSSDVNSTDNLLSNLSLKGLVSTSNQIYALINYLGQEGTVTKNSIGGINTKYLPNGAKLKEFNLSNSEITILLNDQEYIIKMTN